MYPSCPLSENIYTDTRHTKERRRVCEGVSKEPDDIFSHLLSRPLHEAIPEELDVRPARSRHHHPHHYRQLILHRPVHNRMKRPRDRCLVHIKWSGRGSGVGGKRPREKERKELERGEEEFPPLPEPTSASANCSTQTHTRRLHTPALSHRTTIYPLPHPHIILPSTISVACLPRVEMFTRVRLERGLVKSGMERVDERGSLEKRVKMRASQSARDLQVFNDALGINEHSRCLSS